MFGLTQRHPTVKLNQMPIRFTTIQIFSGNLKFFKLVSLLCYYRVVKAQVKSAERYAE